MSDEILRPNPYVGPRAFETGEKLFGRDREVRDLLNFLLSQRVVLLFSPSGAGKTSLIRAGLIPSLQERGLKVRRVIRMNAEPESSLPEGSDSPTPNRYILSAMTSLEEDQPEELRLSTGDLAGLTLGQYLDSHLTQETASGEGQLKRELLIFDQFEEILTLDPTDLTEKAAFFSQLGDCLDERRRFALFSIREDFIAGLDPYLRYIPTHLDHSYRLDLLGVEAASSAIQHPAKELGVTFAPSAVRKLVDDLRRVQVQRLDGSLEELPGPYVEPVQLQVVCFRLWQNLSSGQATIDEEDLLKAGDVNQSLANYYRECVTRIADGPGEERLIRRWFDRQLITEQGFRNQVLLGKDGSGGLHKQTIDALDHAYLIRGEKRRGATWYELAHDRLVEPVRRANASWFQENLSLLQRQAEIWEKESRPEHLLLREQALGDAQAWAEQHAGEMTEAEQAFLQESLEADRREREAREAKQRYERSLRRRLVLATLAALAALIMGAIAFSFGVKSTQTSQANATLAEQSALSAAQAGTSAAIARENASKAEQNQFAAQTQEANAAKARQTAEAASTAAVAAQSTAQANADKALEAYSAQLAAQGQQVLDKDPSLAALLGVEALRVKDTFAAQDLLLASLDGLQRHQVMEYAPVIQTDQSKQNIPLTTLATSPNGEDLAWGLGSGLVQIYNLSQKSVTRSFNTGGGRAVTALAFSQQPSFSILAISDEGGRVYLHDLASEDPAENKRFIQYPSVRDLAFNPQKSWLAVVTELHVYIEDVIELLNSPNHEKAKLEQFSQPATINCIAWSPDGRYLATGSNDRQVRVWDTENEDLKVIGELNGEVSSVAWSPDGKLLAAASRGARLNDFKVDHRLIVVWSFPDGVEVKTLDVFSNKVNTLSFSPDGKVLASAGDIAMVAFTETDQWATIGYYTFYFTGSTTSPRDDVEKVAFFHTPFPTYSLSLLAAAQYGGQVAQLSVNPVRSMAQDVVTDLRGISNLAGDVIGLDVRPDGSLSAVIYDDETATVSVVKAPDLQQAKQGKKVEQGVNIPVKARVAAFSPDHRLLALGDAEEPVVSAYDPETGFPVFRKTILAANSSSPVYGLAFSSDGSRLAALLCAAELQDGVCDDGQRLVQVLDAASGETVGQAIREAETPSMISLSLKGVDKPLTLYHDAIQNSTLLLPFDAALKAFTRGPEDAWFAGTNGYYLYLWDAERGVQLGPPLSGSRAIISSYIRSLVFNKQDGLLYTGLENGSIQAWNMNPQDWIREACQAANRNPTQSEWETYFPGQTYRPTCPDLK